MPTNHKPKKRGPGRPRLDPTGALRRCTVQLSPTQIDAMRALGGSVNMGVRRLIEQHMRERASQ